MVGMSHSRRYRPFVPWGSSRISERWDKHFAQRRLRRATAAAVRQDADLMPDQREVTQYWTWAKDWWQRVQPGERRWRGRRPPLAK
jgi:hypothetical protein